MSDPWCDTSTLLKLYIAYVKLHLQYCGRAPTWLTTALVWWNALTTILARGVADIMSVTMPLLSIKDLVVAIFTRVGPAEDDPLLHK